ncbi:MAG TPA: sulfotransferase, partial [Sphingomicrobium sp.]|nr:sulfotransferase [Sphingomicrobium sp.]
FADIGAEYLERARPFRLTDRPLFIDKQPANWMHAGLIRLALPNARIVDARRHPMACGFSNFKQHYATGVTFSYSLESIGHFYRDYWRYMNHIDAVQPGAVHRIVNERLIDDPEGEVRRLLDFVGVPFDPACLEFHTNTRAVRTPSAEQVRRPINRDGVDYWRHYEPWLGPLKQALGPALEHWDRPPPARSSLDSQLGGAKPGPEQE